MRAISSAASTPPHPPGCSYNDASSSQASALPSRSPRPGPETSASIIHYLHALRRSTNPKSHASKTQPSVVEWLNKVGKEGSTSEERCNETPQEPDPAEGGDHEAVAEISGHSVSPVCAIQDFDETAASDDTPPTGVWQGRLRNPAEGRPRQGTVDSHQDST